MKITWHDTRMEQVTERKFSSNMKPVKHDTCFHSTLDCTILNSSDGVRLDPNVFYSAFDCTLFNSSHGFRIRATGFYSAFDCNSVNPRYSEHHYQHASMHECMYACMHVCMYVRMHEHPLRYIDIASIFWSVLKALPIWIGTHITWQLLPNLVLVCISHQFLLLLRSVG